MNIETKTIGFCKDCLSRDNKNYCNNDHILEDWGQLVNNNDCLRYSFAEGGGFKVDDNFGCVHFNYDGRKA